MNENEIELYGGPLDGLRVEIPADLLNASMELRIPYNAKKEGPLAPEEDIGPQYEETQAVYVRMKVNLYHFKTIVNETGDTPDNEQN